MAKKEGDIKVHSIPPGLKGETHGQLTLVVDKIIWLVEQPPLGRVRAEWWGSKTGQQADFYPVYVRNSGTLCKAGGSTRHCYSVNTGRLGLTKYFFQASWCPLVLTVSNREAQARVPLSIDGVDDYFPLLNIGKEVLANIHVKITYSDLAEQETNSEEEKEDVKLPLAESNEKIKLLNPAGNGEELWMQPEISLDEMTGMFFLDNIRQTHGEITKPLMSV